MRWSLILISLISLAGACAAPAPAPALSDDRELNTFLESVRESLEAHAWQDVIDLADPAHYRTQVADHGMPESQYVAELLGLHRVGNDISRGLRPDWNDLERIRAIRLEALDGEGGEHRLTGEAVLENGERLEVRARISAREGRYVLTGGVG